MLDCFFNYADLLFSVYNALYGHYFTHPSSFINSVLLHMGAAILNRPHDTLQELADLKHPQCYQYDPWVTVCLKCHI